MTKLTRRSFVLKSLTGAAGMSVCALPGRAAANDAGDGFKPAELEAMESAAAAFMEKHKVPGLSVAITKDERLVYAKGFGLADKAKGEPVTPDHLFRIASVSKPFTSVTIFRLIEAGKLNLKDKVFGPGAILGTDFGEPPYKPRVDEITIEHLLTHTAGGWSNNDSDPMFSHPEMDHKQLITWTIAHQALENYPGGHYAYSNFGFCVLGRVIEKLTGKAYVAAVEEEVFKPCGITGMRIGGNTRSERAPNEVIYYDQDHESPYGMNVRRMDAHGGWLASPTDLTRFLVRVDNFPLRPDILKSDTIRTMTTGSNINPNYAKGWCVNSRPNWWHDGSLPGTSTIMARTSGGLCWAALTNTRKMNSKINGDLDHLMWDMVGKITTWPAHDLFG